jgi:kynurenine formamidase
MTMRIVDLSVPLADNMPRYPSPYLPPVQLKAVARHEKEARSAQVITCGTHVSTHVDAPFHAVPGGCTIEAIPLDRFFGSARVLRIRGRDKTTPITASDLSALGDLVRWEKLVIDTGWASRTWGTKEYFTEGPFLSRDAAEMLAELPRLHLIGMDFPNIDAANETVVGTPAPNHRIVLGKQIILLENLLHLEDVDDQIVLSAAPPQLTGGDGCPCRALAFFPVEAVARHLAGSVGSPRL